MLEALSLACGVIAEEELKSIFVPVLILTLVSPKFLGGYSKPT